MEKKSNLCFVIMPFNDEYNELYENYLKRLIEHQLKSVKCFRVDEFHTAKKKKTEVIEEKIKDCAFAIADITEKNPNVFYEIGFARALGKTVILIKNKHIGKLPFDIRELEVLIYDRDKIGYNDINKQILASLENDFGDLIKKPNCNMIQNSNPNSIIGRWGGRYWVKKVEHNVTLYIDNDNHKNYSALCYVDITNKGINYRIRETMNYNQKLNSLDWRDGEWIEFIGTTYVNESDNRLDYWLDAYAINESLQDGKLEVKIWDNVNREKRDVLFTRIS